MTCQVFTHMLQWTGAMQNKQTWPRFTIGAKWTQNWSIESLTLKAITPPVTILSVESLVLRTLPHHYRALHTTDWEFDAKNITSPHTTVSTESLMLKTLPHHTTNWEFHTQNITSPHTTVSTVFDNMGLQFQDEMSKFHCIGMATEKATVYLYPAIKHSQNKMACQCLGFLSLVYCECKHQSTW